MMRQPTDTASRKNSAATAAGRSACRIPASRKKGRLIVPVVLALVAAVGIAQGSQGNEPRTPLDALCADIQNSYECAQAIERHQLQQPEYARKVVRKDKELHLQLRNGKSLTLRDTQPAEEASSVAYSFREYLSEIGYFLLHRQYYEGDEYVLIQDPTGEMFPLRGVPVLSPDKQRLVTTFPGLRGGYNPNSVEIWLVSSAGLTQEYSIHPRDWEPTVAAWVDSRTIRLETQSPARGDGKIRTQTVELKLADKWVLEEPAPAGNREPHELTLCNENEKVIFSAAVEGDDKLLSLCGSNQLDERRGYLQYRFGHPGKVEVEFPAERRDTQSAFRYTRYTRPRVTYLTLKFETDSYRYSLHQDHDAEQEPARLEAYVTISPVESREADPEPVVLRLRAPAQGSLMDLESVVPNVPWSEASPPTSAKPAPELSPREVLLAAKKVFLVNNSPDQRTFDLLRQKLRQWNRWQIVDRRTDADLVLFFSADRVAVDGPAPIERPYRDYRYLMATKPGVRRPILSVRCEVTGDASITAEALLRELRQEVEKNEKREF